MAAETCVITGASRGIGLATALRFARGGRQVVMAARTEADLAAGTKEVLAAGGRCAHVVADVGTRAGAQRVIDVALKTFGRIDVLVNNAGAAPLSPIERMSDDDFEQALRANIAGVFYMTRAAWPALRRQGSGTVVNISSLAAVDPFPGFAVYGACKAWVSLFTKAADDEGRPLGIRVFAIAPGAVETAMLRQNFPDIPAEQTLAPDEVAGMIEAVCEPRASHASGQTIFIRK